MEINWIQAIATILGSSIISSLVTGLWLNDRTEKLKSELQIRLYEFQTRYSWLHQETAKTVKEMFSNVAEIQLELPSVLNLCQIEGSERQKIQRMEIFKKCAEVYKFYRKNKILFSKSTREIADSFFKALNQILSQYDNAEFAELQNIYHLEGKFTGELKQEAFENSKTLLPQFAEALESEFRQLLSAENPNSQLEKKQ